MVAEMENPGSTKGRDGKSRDTPESLAGIIVSHGQILDMQKRRKEFEEALVSANSDFGEGGKLAPFDVAPEDLDAFVSESFKHVRNREFHVKEGRSTTS